MTLINNSNLNSHASLCVKYNEEDKFCYDCTGGKKKKEKKKK